MMPPSPPAATPSTPRAHEVLALVPVLLASVQILQPRWVEQPWHLALTFAACGLLLGSAQTAHRRAPRRALAVLAAAAWLGSLGPALVDSPGQTLWVLLGTGFGLWWLWEPPPLTDGLSHRQARRTRQLAAASAFTLATTAMLTLQREMSGPGAAILALALLCWSPALHLWWRQSALPGWQARVLAVVWLASAGAAGLMVVAGWRADPWLLPPLVLAWAIDRSPTLPHRTAPWWGPVLESPARLMVTTFALLAVLGTALLAIPPSSTHPLALVDVAFTAVSAVCVTGLVVLSTPGDFSGAGQLVLLLLIQLGGLGIMTFSTAALASLGRRLSLRHEATVAGLLSDEDQGMLFRSLRRLLQITLGLEAAGALLLMLLYVQRGMPWLQAAWYGLFTSVSAFCNAGFALHDDNLVWAAGSPGVLHVVAGLIIAGGLSPLVVASLPRLLRGQHVPLGTRLAVWSTAILLVVGTMVFAAFEWTQSLASLSWMDRLHNAWFQSVTLRTAGFNSVDLAATRPATQVFMDVWMFIGGSPGGTAGGIKTTTVAVLLLALRGAWQGRWEAQAFGRRLTARTVYKAAAIATAGILSVLMALVAVLLTQNLGLDRALFEVVSALGTVGLSLGGTGQLDDVGKIVIMVSMFVGRVGPLTLFLLLAEGAARQAWQLPEEDIAVG